MKEFQFPYKGVFYNVGLITTLEGDKICSCKLALIRNSCSSYYEVHPNKMNYYINAEEANEDL